MNSPNIKKLDRAHALSRQGLTGKARELFHAFLKEAPTSKPAIEGLVDLAGKAKAQGSAEMPTALIGEIVSLYRGGESSGCSLPDRAGRGRSSIGGSFV
jgi:hypothetical protein